LCPAAPLRRRAAGADVAVRTDSWGDRSAGDGRGGGGPVRRSRRGADPAHRHRSGTGRGEHPGRPHFGAEPRESLSPPHGEDPPAMNLKTFLAMLARDARVARRNMLTLGMQT